MRMFEFQEIYLNQDSKYADTNTKTYLVIDKIVSVVIFDIKNFPKKVYGVRLLDGLSYKGHSEYLDILIKDSKNET